MMTRCVSLAGLALAAASGIGATAIHAQAPPRLNAPAYYIAEFELTDPGHPALQRRRCRDL